MFCYSSPDTFVPQDHPLRPIRTMVDKPHGDLSSEFGAMYSHTGRPSVPPEKLQILFRRFAGLSLDDEVWDPSAFSQNQERPLRSEVAKKFFDRVLAHANNDTQASAIDPHTSLYRKSSGARTKLSYLRNVLMGNRRGLVVDTRLEQATGTAECEAALSVLSGVAKARRRTTVEAGKGFDNADLVAAARAMKVAPHVAHNTTNQESAVDGGATCAPGYAVRLRLRKCVEDIFGRVKTTGWMRKSRNIGQKKAGWHFTLVAVAYTYNLVRMKNVGLGCSQRPGGGRRGLRTNRIRRRSGWRELRRCSEKPPQSIVENIAPRGTPP